MKLKHAFLVLAAALPLCCQSIPEVNPKKKPTRPGGKPDWLLPLAYASEAQVEAYYQKDSWFSGPQQVKFLYGFGEGSKSLSADLATMLFHNGIQVSLGSSVTATANTGQPPAEGEDTPDSPTQAIERLKAGGDFFVRAAYPLIAMATKEDAPRGKLTVTSISRLGFNINGFGSEATITQATEHNFNTSLEARGRYAAIKNQGFVYGIVRSGWQNVQQEFAVATNLPHRNFMLTQIAAGLQFGDYLCIGFQRFYGPQQAFGTTKSELSKWHVVVQLTPPPKK